MEGTALNATRPEGVGSTQVTKRKRAITTFAFLSLLLVSAATLVPFPYHSTILYLLVGAGVTVALAELGRAFVRPVGYVLPAVALLLGSAVLVSCFTTLKRDAPKCAAGMQLLEDLAAGDAGAAKADMVGAINDDDIQGCIELFRKHGGIKESGLIAAGNVLSYEGKLSDNSKVVISMIASQPTGAWKISNFMCTGPNSEVASAGVKGFAQ